MYRYINILSISMFCISLYVLYGNYKSSKGKRYIASMIMLSTIIIFKLPCTVEGYSIINHMNSDYACGIMIILFMMILNTKEKQSKKDKLIIFINCLLVLVNLIVGSTKGISIYTKMINVYLLMTTLYLFSIKLHTSKSKMKSNSIIIAYFAYVSIGLVMQYNKVYIEIGSGLDLISSIYIFIKIFNSNLIDLYNQKVEITSKLSRSNITMKIHEEKLNTNKKISKTIYDNLDKKTKIVDMILSQYNRCVLLIDDEGYILNEDDGFSKMWKEYKDCKYKINLKTFLKRSIKNQKDFIDSIKKVNNTQKEISGELEGKDGRFFSCTYAPFIIQDKKVGLICIINDITYKKKSEIKIRENDIKYKKIVDNIPYSILLTDSKEILYSNKKNSYIDFYKKDIKNIILEPSTNGELYYTNNNGIEACLNIYRKSFVDGQDIKNLIVVRDITSYKNLLKAVEYNKKKYETLVNIIPEGIYILNFENKALTYANAALLDMIDKDNIEDMELNNINENTVITSGNTNDIVKFNRNTVNNRYGEEIHIESGAMLIDVNQRLKLIGIVRNITEEVKAEEMEREIEEKKRANKIKDDFFINMSHELKTPLNLIHSSNQLIEVLYKNEIKNNPNEELACATSVVKKYLYMLMGLINNIMDLAKLESDFHEVKRDNYNIINIIEDVVNDFNNCININNIDIVFDTDEEEKIANVDPDDIEKIILTLLSFVIRYSKNNSMIYVDLKSKDNITKIYIKNNGQFDYNRYTRDQEKRNLDIGITVAKHMIDLYEGSIDIKTNHKDVDIIVEIKVEEKIKNYRKRTKNRNDDLIYAEYIRMCNF